MNNQEMDFSLIAWIKKEQQEIQEHQQKMALKYSKEDRLYIDMMAKLIPLPLKTKERIMVFNFLRHKKDGKVITPAQRSCITNLFYKYSN